MSRAAIGLTKPAAGVIATNPATAPEIAPSALGLPFCTHSAAHQPMTAEAAPRWVATNALVAKLPAPRALPALKPNHPTHSRQAPIKLSTMLCGFMPVGYPMRLPRYRAHTKAETPEVICTTVPPAKSKHGIFPPKKAFSSPALPHTI